MQNPTTPTDQLNSEIDAIARASIEQLRQRWHGMFRTEPPLAFGPDLLRRSITQRLQEQCCGGLSAPVQRRLNEAIKAMKNDPAGRIDLPRRIKPGAAMVREWKDKSYRVTVLERGFEFEGRRYTSLSEIARQITGTRWNGPRFFGLRNSSSKSASIQPAENEARHVD